MRTMFVLKEEEKNIMLDVEQIHNSDKIYHQRLIGERYQE